MTLRAKEKRTTRWLIAAAALLIAGSAPSCVVERDCHLTASCITPAQATAPQVTTTWPADGEHDVSTRPTLVATFSAPLDASTVTSDSFVVTNDLGEVIPGTVSYDDTTGATFVADEPLALLAAHTMTLTDAIADPQGRPLANAPVSRGFTTVDGVWDDPFRIGGGWVAPRVAVAPNGDAVVVGSASVVGPPLTTVHFDAAEKSWSTPAPLDGSESASDPCLAIDAGGNAIAAWRHSAGGIFASRFAVAEMAWGPPQQITQIQADVFLAPRIATDGAGNAMVMWEQLAGANYTVWASHFTLGVGWTAPHRIDALGGTNSHAPDLAMAANGDAFAIWQDDVSAPLVKARRFTVDTGWDSPQTFDTGDQTAFSPRIAATDDGGAAAVWEQRGAHVSLWARRYTSDGGWGAPALIEPNGGLVSQASVAMAASGEAIAVWTQRREATNNVWANASSPAEGWGDVTFLEAADDGWSTLPQVATDRRGNAIAVWTRQHDGTGESVWSNRRGASGAWGGAELHEANSGNADSVQLAVAPSGTAAVVWRQLSGAQQNVWVSLFRAPEP